MQVRFDYAADEQLERMWASFDPAAAARAADFRSALRAALEGRAVTTADLQHFFVTQVEDVECTSRSGQRGRGSLKD